MMWLKYKRRVLLAMSSQAFVQLVSRIIFFLDFFCDDLINLKNGINGGIYSLVPWKLILTFIC